MGGMIVKKNRVPKPAPRMPIVKRKTMVLSQWKRKAFFDFGDGLARERNPGDEDLIPVHQARGLAAASYIDIIGENPFDGGMESENVCGC